MPGCSRHRIMKPMSRFKIGFLPEYSDEALLNELRRVASQFTGENLTQPEFLKLSHKVSPQTLQRRFGTWRNALAEAGLTHLYSPPKRFTDTECFENLANVWTTLGRCPEYLDMKKPPSTIMSNTYRRRWRTWRKALSTFVEWADTEAAIQATNAASSNNSLTTIRSRSAESDRVVRPGLRFKVFMRDRFRCVGCGRSPATHLNVELHADHVISVYDGGRTTLENLQTLCQECNLGKGRMSIRKMGELSI